MKLLIFRLLLIIVALSPLPFGSNRPWSWSLLSTLIGILLLAWGVISVFDKGSQRVSLRRIWPVLALFILAVGWTVVQSSHLTPLDWHNPLWNRLSTVFKPEISSSITLDVDQTQTALMRLLSYAGVFWLSLQYCRSSGQAQQVFLTLSVTGTAYAIYGLINYFSGSEMILWFHKWAYRSDLTSTFVNRNNYATYAGLGLLCSIGVAFQITLDNIRGVFDNRRTVRAILESFFEQGWLFFAGFPIILTALLFTHSRGGFLSFAAGIMALLLGLHLSPTLKSHPIISRVKWGASITIAMMIIAIISLSGGILESRFSKTSLLEENRLKYYESTIRAINEIPLLGTGYGTFKQVFRIYKDPSLTTLVDKAHNTYLENAMELGLPAAFALVGAIAGLGIICLFGIRQRRRNIMYPIIGLAATVLVGAHSLVDFSLQIPAVAVTYALIMGAACAQSWPSTRTHSNTEPNKSGQA